MANTPLAEKDLNELRRISTQLRALNLIDKTCYVIIALAIYKVVIKEYSIVYRSGIFIDLVVTPIGEVGLIYISLDKVAWSQERAEEIVSYLKTFQNGKPK